ncbi:uncharacterized protein LOC110862629 isoform X2 [Folsomia candida]|uniref:uncharacterized protein LOC110862629 isoform X2 n=1 Tax=Folsomia candida TaxID=158441 RepID=UPI001604EB0C|nr:uncharacterized protein LOC110862629 isoform X2 [Folsomia candida]
MTSFQQAFAVHCYIAISVIFMPVRSLPFPKPLAEPNANPTPQFPPIGHSQSSQHLTMYKPIQIGYQSPAVSNSGGGGFNPLYPVFTYNYNVSHPLKPYGQQPGSRQSGVLLDSQQVQYLMQGQQRRGIQTGQPLQLQYQRQFQQNKIYAPVIITNSNAIKKPTQNLVASGRGAFYETDSEEPGLGLRTNTVNGSPRTRTDKLILDQRVRSQQSLSLNQQAFNQQSFRYPENVAFPNINNQFSPQSIVQLPYNTGITTTRPPIHVPYLTTPNSLKKLQQIQKNSQQTIAGFRSHLGLINPASIQSTSLIELDRNSLLNLSPAIRSGRVQNIVVPVSTAGQTPAGTRLLQQNINSLQNLQNVVANNVYAHQRGQQLFTGRTLDVDLSSPNLHILKGIAITPENQRDVGHLIFTDPRNPTVPNGAVLASTAQKVFILPQGGDNLAATDSGKVGFITLLHPLPNYHLTTHYF